MNIALVNPEYPTRSGFGHGGIATYTYNIANALSMRGHSVFLFIREGVIPDTLNRAVKIITFTRAPLPFLKRITSRLLNINRWDEEYSYGLYKSVLSVYDKVSIDIIDIPEYNGLAAAFKKHFPIPIVLNFRTPRIIVDHYNNRKIKSIDKRVYKLEQQAIKSTKNYRTSSNALKNEIIKLYKLPKDQLKVIRNPMVPIKCSKQKDSHKIKVLFVGRLENRKGLNLLINSYKDLLNLSDNIELHIVGQIDEDVKHFFKNTKVFFHGEVNHQQLKNYYCSSNIFIFPSIFDNSPNTLLEAMAASLPIIASNAPGVNEIIKDNHNGLLFKTDSKDEFIEKINLLINNNELCTRLSHQALEDIKDIFSPEKICNETIDFYRHVIQQESL